VGTLLAGLIPTALAFAVSPISLIELILVVFSRRARVNGIVFLLTVAVPTFVIPVLGATLVKNVSDGSGGGGGSAWVKLVFGVLLLLLAVVNLRSYRKTDTPKVFDTIERMSPGAVFGLALGVTLANPKNLAVLLSAGETMREANVSAAQMLVGVAVFTFVAMLPYAAVIGYQRWGGEAAANRLAALKAGLLRNNHKIMFWICLLIGLMMTGRGLAALFA
jgi:threonine/homoserine/homoserine lactone efflux protein